MVEKFTMEPRSQHEWAWLLALYLFFGSLGGCLFLLFQIFHLPVLFALIALALVLLGAVTLLFKLGSPQRAWRAIFRPSTSWISRGVVFVSCFAVFGCLAIAPAFAALSWLPWHDGSVVGKTLGLLAGLSALMTALYPGFVVSNSRAIPFWNTPVMPVLLFSYAAMGASGIVLIGSSYLAADGLRQVEVLAAGLIVLNLVLLGVYLFVMQRTGGSAKESVRRLNQAPLSGLFWIGVVVVGLIFPLAAVIWLASAVALAGACLLIGGLLFRHCVLKAGVYVPPPLSSGEVDFSKLNRTSADFEREYRGMAAHSAGRRA